MVRRVVFVVVGLAGTVGVAAGQPRKPRPPAAKVPMREVPCAPDSPQLAASGIDPLVCWDKGCMKLDFEGSTATWIVPPASSKPWLMSTPVVEDTRVCLGTTCKAFGKTLTAAIAARRADKDATSAPDLAATTDLKAIVIDSKEVWSVARDRVLKLPKPASYRRDKEVPEVAGVEPAGDLLVVQWAACAGPCTRMNLVDSSGRQRGPEGTGGGPVFQLDAKRFVVVGEWNEVQIYELGTGKSRGTVDPGPNEGPEPIAAIRMDDETIAYMYQHHGGQQVVKIQAAQDPKTKPMVVDTMYLPSCTP